jgi:WD40 repeat protein
MVMFWDTSTGGESKMEVRHTCGVTGIAVSSDGHRAVSASEDGTLIVWHLEDIIEQIARDHAQDSDRENDDPEDSDTASASQSGDEADDRSEDDDDDSCVGPGWRSSRRGRRGERW